MQEKLDILQYVKAFKRKKFYFIVPFVAVFFIAGIIIFSLPPVYKSAATILIEAQEIPRSLVRTTVTGYVEERLQSISQRVLSRKNLLDIITQFNLYPGLMKTHTTEEVLEKMRDGISMKPIQAEVTNPESGRSGSATIAFTLSYEGEDPKKAAQVANALLSFYLEENLRARKQKAGTTYEFLETQIEGLKEEIQETEKQIAAFKEENLHSLPELMGVNLQALERTQNEIDAKREFIKMAMDQKTQLEAQLIALKSMGGYAAEGERSLTLGERLENLRNHYLSLTVDHSEKHPDVIKLKNQIKVLEKEVAAGAGLREEDRELKDKQTQLGLLLEKYSENHPDVVKLKKELEALRRKIDDASRDKTILSGADTRADSPVSLNLKAQIVSKEMEIQRARDQLTQLERKYEKYQRRVEETPGVEQRFKFLQRDYAVAQAKYQDVLSRLRSAKEAKGLEESRMGEKFTVIELPNVPGKPEKPNRPALLFVAFLLATGAGAGSGAMAEYMDNSVHNSEDLADLSGLPVLSVIPYMHTSKELAARKKRRWIVFLGTTIFIFAAVLGVHFFYQPLDLIWLRITR